MKPKTYQLLEFAIENGLKLGFNRAHKHNDNPAQDYILDQQLEAIMLEIHNWFDWPENNSTS
jgi:hypothetical protein